MSALKINKDTRLGLPFHISAILFISLPYHHLIKKIFSFVPNNNYWKEGLMLLFFATGFLQVIKSNFFKVLLLFILIIFYWNLAVINNSDYTFIFFFLDYAPLAYFAYHFHFLQNKPKYIFVLIAILVSIIPIFVFFEIRSNGVLSYIFMDEQEGFSVIRDGEIRARYCFDSGNGLCQYCWFISLFLLEYYSSSHKKFVYLISILLAIVAYETLSRAVFFLYSLSLVFRFASTILNSLKIGFKPFLIISIFLIWLASNFINLDSTLKNQKSLDKKIADIQRIQRINKGYQLASENWFLGLGGSVFYHQSSKYIDTEQTWVTLIYTFGIVGIFFSLYLFNKLIVLNYKENYLYLLVISMPWFLYTFIFPVFQDRVSLYITMYLIGLNSIRQSLQMSKV